MKSSTAYKYSNVSLPSNSVCHGHLPLCLFSMNPESRTLTPNFHCLSSKCFAFLSWRFHALSSTCSTKIKSKSVTFPPPMPYFFTSLFLHTDLHFPLSAGNSDKKCAPPWAFIFFPWVPAPLVPGSAHSQIQGSTFCPTTPQHFSLHHSLGIWRFCKINSPVTSSWLIPPRAPNKPHDVPAHTPLFIKAQRPCF